MVFKKRYLMIEGNILYVCKSKAEPVIIGCVELSFCLCKFEQLILQKKPKEFNSSSLYGFTLTRNRKNFEVYLDSENIFNDWMEILSIRTLLSTFNEEFKVQKLIGRDKIKLLFPLYQLNDSIFYLQKEIILMF